jgi:hypothetical protein
MFEISKWRGLSPKLTPRSVGDVAYTVYVEHQVARGETQQVPDAVEETQALLEMSHGRHEEDRDQPAQVQCRYGERDLETYHWKYKVKVTVRSKGHAEYCNQVAHIECHNGEEDLETHHWKYIHKVAVGCRCHEEDRDHRERDLETNDWNYKVKVTGTAQRSGQ